MALYYPDTRAEAETWRYGQWSGNPEGRLFDPARCAYSVSDAGGYIETQCSRKPGHGPDGLFCKQHAARIEKYKPTTTAPEESE